jgi:hypothetical protein
VPGSSLCCFEPKDAQKSELRLETILSCQQTLPRCQAGPMRVRLLQGQQTIRWDRANKASNRDLSYVNRAG